MLCTAVRHPLFVTIFIVMSQRLLRVRELLKREIGTLLTRDYEFDALVTVNDVSVSPDLRQGSVYVGIIGDDRQKRRIIARLNGDRGSIQRRIAKRVVLKFTPQLNFEADDSVERGVRTLSVIEEIDRQQQEATPPAEGAEGLSGDEG